MLLRLAGRVGEKKPVDQPCVVPAGTLVRAETNVDDDAGTLDVDGRDDCAGVVPPLSARWLDHARHDHGGLARAQRVRIVFVHDRRQEAGHPESRKPASEHLAHKSAPDEPIDGRQLRVPIRDDERAGKDGGYVLIANCRMAVPVPMDRQVVYFFCMSDPRDFGQALTVYVLRLPVFSPQYQRVDLHGEEDSLHDKVDHSVPVQLFLRHSINTPRHATQAAHALIVHSIERAAENLVNNVREIRCVNGHCRW